MHVTNMVISNLKFSFEIEDGEKGIMQRIGNATDLSRLYKGSSINSTCGLITSSLAMLTLLLSPLGSLFIKQCPPMSLSARSASDIAAMASSTMDLFEDKKPGSWRSAEK